MHGTSEKNTQLEAKIQKKTTIRNKRKEIENNRKKNQKLQKAFELRVSSLDLGLSFRFLRNQRIDLSLGG